jgi:hypothetical protein
LKLNFRLVLPIIFIVLILGGALLVLFPGPAAIPEPTHDPYLPPPDDPDDPNDPYYTGDLAGTAFELWGVTPTGDILITDMESFSALTGSVYYGTTLLTNVYLNILCSYSTYGFIYDDPAHPLKISGVLGIDDWTAYSLPTGGTAGSDIYNLPYSLYGFALDTGVGDSCEITSHSRSPTAPSPTTPVTISIKATGSSGAATDDEHDGNVDMASPLDRFSPSAVVQNIRLTYEVDGVSKGTLYFVEARTETEASTCTIPAQAGGAVVTYIVTATYGSATDSVSGSYTVSGGTQPAAFIYYLNQYASDDDRANYQKQSIQRAVIMERTAASGTDILLGSIYFINPNDGSPFFFPQTTLDSWYNWAWFQVWTEKVGTPLPEQGILRTYMRAYVNIEGEYETSSGYDTQLIQSEWSHTVGVNLGTASGITGAGTQVAASAFGGSGDALPMLPVIIMLLGGFGFLVTFGITYLQQVMKKR